MKDIKHVQLEAGAFISDVDFQLMNAEQRGIYCSIIFYLYANGGRLELNNTDITLLSNKTNKLALISNCNKTGVEWQQVWSQISHKFQLNNNILTHKRVTAELKKVEEFKRKKSAAGRAGMKNRWGKDNTDITNISKVNINKENNIYTLNGFTLPPDKQTWDDISFRVGLTQDESDEAYINFGANGWKRGNKIEITSWEQVEYALTYWRNHRNEFKRKEGTNLTTKEQIEKLKKEGRL